jgi:hypothetical protein
MLNVQIVAILGQKGIFIAQCSRLSIFSKVDVMKNGRCWQGYEPVKGKKPYSQGSCKKSSLAKKTQSKPKPKGK